MTLATYWLRAASRRLAMAKPFVHQRHWNILTVKTYRKAVSPMFPEGYVIDNTFTGGYAACLVWDDLAEGDTMHVTKFIQPNDVDCLTCAKLLDRLWNDERELLVKL